jgi:uncharacterized cupredoxin-like copper-binding protein
MMRQPVLFIVLFSATFGIRADEPRNLPQAVEVRVQAGTVDGKHVFVPNKLSFKRGVYYKLVIHNPSPEDHYFTSDALATHVFTRKVEVGDRDGKTIAEIHGDIREIELKPGAMVEWYFYPMTNGENLKFFCHKEGHEEDGMHGVIEISGPAPFTSPGA